MIPTPQTIVNGQGRYAFSVPSSFSEEQFITNVDFLQRTKSKLTGKFFFANQDSTLSLAAGYVPGSPQSGFNAYRNLSVTHDYIFNSDVINEAQAGFHRTAVPLNNASSFTFPAIGSSVIPQSANFASVTIAGTERIGAAGTISISSNGFTLQDTLTISRGRHSWRFGGGVTRTNLVSNNLVISGLVFLSVPDFLLG